MFHGLGIALAVCWYCTRAELVLITVLVLARCWTRTARVVYLYCAALARMPMLSWTGIVLRLS